MKEIIKAPQIRGKIGIGWNKLSRSNEEYVAIKVSVPVDDYGKQRRSHTLVIFKNKNKNDKNNFDYVVYPSRKKFIKIDEQDNEGLDKSMYKE